MAVKSIRRQIIDEFIEELSKTGSIEGNRLDSLRELLIDGKVKKEELVSVLTEED
jgi:hypothetical protein